MERKKDMKKLYRILIAVVLGVMATSCGPHGDVLEPETPLIVGQTITTGTTQVDVALSEIYIVFDREVKMRKEDAVYFEPAVAAEISAEGTVLTIKTTEALRYECDYLLTIGKGAVVDALTGGENNERVIGFRTKKGPYVPPTDPATVLVTPGATMATQNVYDFLWANYGNKTLSSASLNEFLNINECEWVYQWTQKHPAILNVDYKYLYVSPSAQMDYASVESTVEDWWDANGLVSASWHWMVPPQEGVKYNYTTDGAATVVRPSNMLTEGTWEHELMMADLKEMASILKAYKIKGIPVLWRPLHEAAGTTYTEANGKPWFWWGFDGAESYVALWRTMFDYFKSEGLTNLIWVWNTQLEDIDFYPGDEYVDIIACDVYNALSASKVVAIWESATSQFPHRMVSLCELGRMCDMKVQLDNGIAWSYFMPWYDNANDLSEGFVHQYATIDWWRAAFADTRVISREDMPSLK